MMRLKETDDVFGANGWCVWSKQTIRFAPARRCMILWIHHLYQSLKFIHTVQSPSLPLSATLAQRYRMEVMQEK